MVLILVLFSKSSLYTCSTYTLNCQPSGVQPRSCHTIWWGKWSKIVLRSSSFVFYYFVSIWCRQISKALLFLSNLIQPQRWSAAISFSFSETNSSGEVSRSAHIKAHTGFPSGESVNGWMSCGRIISRLMVSSKNVAAVWMCSAPCQHNDLHQERCTGPLSAGMQQSSQLLHFSKNVAENKRYFCSCRAHTNLAHYSLCQLRSGLKEVN